VTEVRTAEDRAADIRVSAWAVVAGQAAQSVLVKLITPRDGAADMPKGKAPLAEGELALITAWIKQGAADDTPADARRFIDNVTSITPGALRGGVLLVATHPTLDHLVTGGSDGLPKVYRIFRETTRQIGDDAQFNADLFPMPGRVFSARFSADGRRIACGSSLDGAGEVVVYSYQYTNDVPKNLRDIMGKVPGSRKP
jgi:hypothetical protein